MQNDVNIHAGNYNTIPVEDMNSIPTSTHNNCDSDRLGGTAKTDDLKNAYKGFRDSILYRQPSR